MSLINEVLKDLERRQAPPETRVRPASGGHRPRPGLSALRRWPLWLAAAVLTGAILHFSLDAEDPRRAGMDPPTLAASAGANAATESTGPSGPDAARDRPQDPAEAAGEASATGALPAAAPSPGAEAAIARIDAGQTAARDRQARTDDEGTEPGERTPESAPAADAPDPSPAPTDESNGASAEPTPEQAPEPEGNISIRRAGKPHERDELERARRALANGRVDLAESRLRELTERQPARGEAWELLATLLIEQGRHGAAAGVLERGLERAEAPADLAALLARVELEAGRAGRASEVLERHGPPLAQAPDYHLLLAAAHRQAGNHTDAADHYRRLGEAFPARTAAWIGLGASLEALDQPDSARDAYRRAADGSDARAARFARERLSVLGEPTGDAQ